jgi:hypothetical protein
MHIPAIRRKFLKIRPLRFSNIANIEAASNVRKIRIRVGQYAVGFPQFALRADSDLVVLQG